MYHIDVTDLVECAELLSGSVAELGETAALTTWKNAVRKAEELHPITDENRDAARDHVRGFGAWSPEEIESWDDAELGALLLQFAAGDLREAERVGVETADDYERECERGRLSGRLWFDDENGKVWYNYQD